MGVIPICLLFTPLLFWFSRMVDRLATVLDEPIWDCPSSGSSLRTSWLIWWELLGTTSRCIDDWLSGSFIFLDPIESIEVAGLSGIMITSGGGGDVADSDLDGDVNLRQFMEFDMLLWEWYLCPFATPSQPSQFDRSAGNCRYLILFGTPSHPSQFYSSARTWEWSWTTTVHTICHTVCMRFFAFCVGPPQSAFCQLVTFLLHHTDAYKWGRAGGRVKEKSLTQRHMPTNNKFSHF